MNPQRPRRTAAEQAELDRADRRQFWIIAVIFTAALVVVTGLYVAVSSTVDPPSPDVAAAEQIDNPALVIPDGGQEPTEPGDRGGSQQLALMGGLILALGLGTAWVVHSSRRARRQLAARRADAGDDNDDTGARVDIDVDGGDPVTTSTASPEPR